MRIASACLLLCLGLALGAADRPHKAQVWIEGRAQPFDAYVLSDQVDKLVYSQDEEGMQKGEFKQEQVLRVDYERVNTRQWYTATGKLNDGDAKAAAQLFAEAVAQARTEYDRVQAYLGQIRAHGAAKDPAGAVAAADAFAAALPRSRFLLEGLEAKTEILLSAGQLDQAEQAFTALAGMDLGPMTPRAKAIAAAGKARVLLAKGDAAAAAAAVDAALGSLNRDKQPAAWAGLGIVGVRAKLKADDAAGAKALAEQLLYLGDDPATQAEAHLVLARQLEGSDKIKAFDHAAIAALRARGNDAKVQGEAASLGRTLAKDLAADQSLSEEDRLAYKEYARKL